MKLNTWSLRWPWHSFALIAMMRCPVLIAAHPAWPIMNSKTSEIIVKFNDVLISSWHLEPQKKPDVFQVGSTLKAKRIKFVSDVDSMEFDLMAGQKKDFIILLNGKEECWTRIDALEDPALLHRRIGVPVAIALAFLFIVPFFRLKFFPTSKLLWLGMIVPSLFWLVTLIAGFLHKHYDHLKMTISELGSIGTGSEMFFSVSLSLISILCIYFSIVFFKVSKEIHMSVIPALLSFSMPISIAWAAIFPLGHELHSALGPLPLVMMMGMLMAWLFWKGDGFKSIKWASGISFVITLLFLMRFSPFVLKHYEGLLQRFFYLGWSIWFISLSFYLRKLINS